MIHSEHNQEGLGIRRVNTKETFIYLLDLEIKRSRRYQEFLCIIEVKLIRSVRVPQGVAIEQCFKKLKDALAKETRATDVVGVLEENTIGILLPYADPESSALAESRFKGFLQPYDFEGRGCEVQMKRLCYPSDGTNTMDLIEKC